MLARVFGCCRVVFNDALRVRDEAYRAGVRLSDSEIQRRVITQAKRTAERCWLAEVPSVALVQSVNDSRRAWRNFFDSHADKRRGRPRMKSKKDHRQSFRLTRNGFRVRATGRLFVAKIGEVLPLEVRAWTCPTCGVVHDRDHNAAKVILAAGRAERINASHDSGRDRANGSGGAQVSPPTTREAPGDEAGSTPTAA
jgi:transposase